MSKRIKQILDLLMQEYPDAGTMLEFDSIFQLLVAVILSAQTTDAQVNRVTAGLFSQYSTAPDFADLDPAVLEDLIKAVGLYKSKAKNIQAMAQKLMQEYGGEVPADLNELITLPGVGRKTANVVLAVGFGLPGLGVDTHVKRLAQRLGLVNTKNADKIEKELKVLIPQEMWSKSHHLLIWHGRRVCKARKPQCGHCLLDSLCPKIDHELS